MVPKVLVLKTGERIIAGASEMTDSTTGKGICLIIKCPYILTLNPKQDNEEEYSVNFSKWNPFSSDNKFNIPYDAVIALGDAEQGILDVYLERFSAELYYEEEDVKFEIPGDQSEEMSDV
jgi:hypothetical protein